MYQVIGVAIGFALGWWAARRDGLIADDVVAQTKKIYDKPPVQRTYHGDRYLDFFSDEEPH